MKTYYKVLYKNPITNKLCSFISHPKNKRNWMIDNGYILEYKKDEWTIPLIKNSDLMCFDDFESAKEMSSKSESLVVYECSVKNPKKKGIFLQLFYEHAHLYLLKDILKLKEKRKRFLNHVSGCPYKDTIFCSAIKINEQVYP